MPCSQRTLSMCNNIKQRDKIMANFRVFNLPDNITFNRFTMLSIVLLSHFVNVCQAIRLDAVLVPQYKFRGHNATLLCKYELEDDEELFSLKWYKFNDVEETEFYRYTPPKPLYNDPYTSSQNIYHNQQYNTYNNNDNRATSSYIKDGRKYSSQRTRTSDTNTRRDSYGNYRQSSKVNVNEPKPDGILTWKVPGIKIDMNKSVPQKVVLKRVTFKSTGVYRCEVTSRVRQIETRNRGYERQRYTPDNFRMKESINRMIVVELPKSRPKINGGLLDNNYKPGDTLNLTCISAPSNPPATLEWRLNGDLVEPDSIIPQHLLDKKKGLFSSIIGLIMLLKEEHFEHGEIRVNCKGTIAAEFWKKDVENIFTDKDRFVKVLEVTESQWPNNQGFRTVELRVVSSIAFMLIAHFIHIVITEAEHFL